MCRRALAQGGLERHALDVGLQQASLEHSVAGLARAPEVSRAPFPCGKMCAQKLNEGMCSTNRSQQISVGAHQQCECATTVPSDGGQGVNRPCLLRVVCGVVCFVFCVLCFVFCVLCFVCCVWCGVFCVSCFVFCVVWGVWCVACAHLAQQLSLGQKIGSLGVGRSGRDIPAASFVARMQSTMSLELHETANSSGYPPK